jgi:hypothetical protein
MLLFLLVVSEKRCHVAAPHFMLWHDGPEDRFHIDHGLA